jgi:hypothetical protein
VNHFTRAVSFRIHCDRPLFLELEALSQRSDVSMIGTGYMPTTKERTVCLEAHSEGYKLLVDLLKRQGAMEKKR